ncbi:MAG: MFS transporter [Proteobacteria bacterium]|nr:MFS transporter [Pseudomonadota bacterium]
MPASFASIAPVLLGVLIAEVALGMMTTLIPLDLASHGVRASVIGAVGSGYFLGFLLGTLTCARLVRAVGHIRAFAVFLAVAADCALLMTMTDTPMMWAVLRLLMGWMLSGMFLVAESWLNDKTDNANRGRTFGAYLLVSWGGAAMGPLAYGLLRNADRSLVMVGLAFATALVPMALTPVSNPPLGERRRFTLKQLFNTSPMGTTCVIASGFVNSSFYTLAPVYLERHGHSPHQIPDFLSACLVAALLVQYPVGMAADRFGRRPMTVVALSLAVIVSILFSLLGGAPFWVLIVLGCMLAGVTAPLYGLGAGQTNDHVARSDYVAASGGLLFAWAVGSSVGPIVAGVIMNHAGVNALFVFLAVTLLALSGFTLLRIRRRPGVESESAFVPARAAPTQMHELDQPKDLQDEAPVEVASGRGSST